MDLSRGGEGAAASASSPAMPLPTSDRLASPAACPTPASRATSAGPAQPASTSTQAVSKQKVPLAPAMVGQKDKRCP